MSATCRTIGGDGHQLGGVARNNSLYGRQRCGFGGYAKYGTDPLIENERMVQVLPLRGSRPHGLSA